MSSPVLASFLCVARNGPRPTGPLTPFVLVSKPSVLPLSRLPFAAAALLSVACATTAPRQAPGHPPTKASVTLANPGGDAHDPEEAALLRQLNLPWRFGEDKDHQLRIPMPDAKHYKRVRYWLIDHFVGFRYGEDFYAANVVLLLDVPKGEEMDSESCMRRAENWGYPQLKSYQVKLEESHVKQARWREQNVFVKTVDGYLDLGFKRRKFSAAYATYAAYPDACMVFGFAVPWGEHEALAKQVRDRWVAEGVPKIEPLTDLRPYRK